MKYLLIFLLLVLGICSSPSPDLLAQELLWRRDYGGDLTDIGYSVVEAPYGGYVLTGISNSNDSADMRGYLWKTDEYGTIVWMKTFLEDGNNTCTFSVKGTLDGGYIVAGTRRWPGELDIYLIKTDADGEIEWEEQYETDSLSETTHSIDQTTDGGYIVAGYSITTTGNNDFFLMKTNMTGVEQWRKWHRWEHDEFVYCVQQTTDGGYIITGSTGLYEQRDLLLMKFDADGDSTWAQRYNGHAITEGKCVLQTTDGGYIVTGHTEEIEVSAADIYILKTDENGDSLWAKTFGYSRGQDWGESIVEIPGNGYIVCGTWHVPGEQWDICALRLNNEGDSLWLGLYGEDRHVESAHNIIITAEGDYLITGTTEAFEHGPNVALLKIASDQTGVGEGNHILPTVTSLHQNYPNPFNATTNIRYSLNSSSEIELTVYDLLGRKVQTLDRGFKKAGNHSVDFDASEFSSGIYFYKLSAGEFSETKKMVLLK